MKILSFTIISILSQLAVAASYDVPVPSDLSANARWNGIEASAKVENGNLKIHYCLPADLVGLGLHSIEAEGPASGAFVPVSGIDVKGYCMIPDSKPVTCILRYPASIVNAVSRDEALKQDYTGDEFEHRSEVARIFGADPAGLLMVDLTGARPASLSHYSYPR